MSLSISNGSSAQIRENTFTQNRLGIHLSKGYNHTIIENQMTSSGLFLEGGKKTFTSQTIGTSNTVNGHPVYYYSHSLPEHLPSPIGQLILGDVHNQRINNVTLMNGYIGIELGFSTALQFTNLTLKNQQYGLYLTHVNATIIKNSTFQRNQQGIYITNSHTNTIHDTNFLTNTEGLRFEKTNNSKVYRNNFKANSIHAIDGTGTNFFNDTTIGNFWEDYKGNDTNQDGIGDTPYAIAGGSLDYLPSIQPFNLSSKSSFYHY